MVSLEVSKTYEIVSEKLASRGESSDNGYCFSPMLLHLKDLVDEVKKLGSFEMQSNPTHIDLYGIDEEIDAHTGDATTYHIRISAKPRAIARIGKILNDLR